MFVSILLNEVLHERRFTTGQRVGDLLLEVRDALVVDDLGRR